MAFPDDALAPHETLVLNLHPHWWYIAKSGIMLVLAVVLLGGGAIVVSNGALSWLATVVILVALIWFATRFVQWISTFFVLTSDRVIWREGVLRRRSVEIPLERINTVFFEQRLFERLLGLGDIDIESASKDGSQSFEDIRRPADVQKEIYIQMERNETRNYDRMGQAVHGSAPAAAPSAADQITQLAALRDAGHITPEEFEAKKAELLRRM